MKTIEDVLAANNHWLMALPGVVGTAIGARDGHPCIRVFVAEQSSGAGQRIPGRLDGYPVVVEVTGPIHRRT